MRLSKMLGVGFGMTPYPELWKRAAKKAFKRNCNWTLIQSC